MIIRFTLACLLVLLASSMVSAQPAIKIGPALTTPVASVVYEIPVGPVVFRPAVQPPVMVKGGLGFALRGHSDRLYPIVSVDVQWPHGYLFAKTTSAFIGVGRRIYERPVCDGEHPVTYGIEVGRSRTTSHYQSGATPWVRSRWNFQVTVQIGAPASVGVNCEDLDDDDTDEDTW